MQYNLTVQDWFISSEYGHKSMSYPERIPVKVPGSLISALTDQGIIDDPYRDENVMGLEELLRHPCTMQCVFQVPGEFLTEDSIELIFYGVDTLAVLYLNGKEIGIFENMHREYRFPVKDVLIEGENTVEVVFRSSLAYGENEQNRLPLRAPHGSLEGSGHVRKAHYMSGWDWAPCLPDMGIWRDVILKASSCCRLGDIQIRQSHHSGDGDTDVSLHIIPSLKCNRDNQELTCSLSLYDPSGNQNVSGKVLIGPNTGEREVVLNVVKPHLWWPSGYGQQPLYYLKIELFDKDVCIDSREFSLGLRTIELDRHLDQWGESFQFTVNGKAIFAKGANFIPDESILAHRGGERLESLIDDCVSAHFNMIRVWGGGYYPDEAFYDLCDKKGILLWHDLMFACMSYELTEEMEASIIDEITQNVIRVRHRACLALWCGNNEIAWGWAEKGWFDKYKPEMKEYYHRMFDHLLPELVQKSDPVTSYWFSSPSSQMSFEDPNNQTRGDMHYWDVWHEAKPFRDFTTTFPRFMSEFGLQSFPSMSLLKDYISEGNRNIYSPIMRSHQKNNGGNRRIMHYVSELYRFPNSLESIVYCSQLIQAEGIRTAVEHWRRNMGRCMGALYWQLNDCWPVASWSSIDYRSNWKALHYYAKRFYAPLLLSPELSGDTWQWYGISDLPGEIEAKVTLKWFEDGVLKNSFDTSVIIKPGSQILPIDFKTSHNELDEKLLRKSFLQYSLQSDFVEPVTALWLPLPPSEMDMQVPVLSLDVHEDDWNFRITISSESLVLGLMLEIEGERTVFSDNFFDMVSGESRDICIEKNRHSSLRLTDVKTKLKYRSLFDSFDG